MMLGRAATMALSILSFLYAAGAAAQGGTITVRVQPNIGTQAKDGFTVCVGTVQNRSLYGMRVTNSTGILQFSGMTSSTSAVVTVTKGGYLGREATVTVPQTGVTSEVLMYMFTGTAGPTCGSSTTAAAAPPAPVTPSSARIIVSPPSGQIRDGFYVCVGNSQNRAAYATRETPMSGEILIQNLPGEGMIKATVVGYGYQGAERDWYPTPGQSVAITIPMSLGQGGFTCPGYTPSNLRTLDVTVMDGFNRVAGAYVCVWGGLASVVLTPTRQTSTRGQVSFTGLPEGQTWNVIASLGGKRARVDLALPHVRDTAIVVPLVTGTVPRCGGAPSAPPPAPAPVAVSGTETIVVAPDPARLGQELLAIRGGETTDWHVQNASTHNCRTFGGNFVMTGLKVRHRVTSMIGLDLYCAALRSDGTLGTRIFLPAMAPTGGTAAEATCPSGQAVVGYQGTVSPTDFSEPIRSLTLHCAPLTQLGLKTGASTRLSPLGIQSGGAWGPDMCSQNRPASGVKASRGGHPDLWIATTQLMCEQPQRPSR